MAEQRKNKRFNALDNALVFVDNIPGQIVDISKGGLSFKYSSLDNMPKDCTRVDILVPEINYYLQNVGCSQISDTAIGKLTQYSNVTIKRRSLKFSRDLLGSRSIEHLVEVVCGK